MPTLFSLAFGLLTLPPNVALLERQYYSRGGKTISMCLRIFTALILVCWASGQVIRALGCCAKHRWFEPNPRIIVGMLAHCPPSSKWVPGGGTGKVKGGEERNWPPYLTMSAAQDKCPSNGHSPNVRNRTWDSPLAFLLLIFVRNIDFLTRVIEKLRKFQYWAKKLTHKKCVAAVVFQQFLTIFQPVVNGKQMRLSNP